MTNGNFNRTQNADGSARNTRLVTALTRSHVFPSSSNNPKMTKHPSHKVVMKSNRVMSGRVPHDSSRSKKLEKNQESNQMLYY